MGLMEAVAAVCSAMIALGILRMLAPEGKLQKTAEVAFGLAALLSIVLPFFGGVHIDINENQSAEQAIALKEMTDAQIISAAETQTSAAISKALEESKINHNNVSAIMDISEDGSISIECVQISDVDPQQTDVAKETVRALLGISPDIVEVKNE